LDCIQGSSWRVDAAGSYLFAQVQRAFFRQPGIFKVLTAISIACGVFPGPVNRSSWDASNAFSKSPGLILETISVYDGQIDKIHDVSNFAFLINYVTFWEVSIFMFSK
jgi:hypothetical protein